MGNINFNSVAKVHSVTQSNRNFKWPTPNYPLKSAKININYCFNLLLSLFLATRTDKIYIYLFNRNWNLKLKWVFVCLFSLIWLRLFTQTILLIVLVVFDDEFLGFVSLFFFHFLFCFWNVCVSMNVYVCFISKIERKTLRPMVYLVSIWLFSRFCICWGGITIVVDRSCVILRIGTFEPCD